MRSDTLLFIPSYNDNVYFYKLIPIVRKYFKGEILCIDDGSDNKIQNKFYDTKINIIYNNENYGKGYSIIKASKYALANNYKYLLVMDSDFQHDPSKIIEFIKRRTQNDIVYGKRNFLKKMPFFRMLSNSITSFLISMKCKKIIYDTQCGYRLYNLSLFALNKFNYTGYQFESEILLKCINKKSSISYVDVPTIYNGSTSNVKPISDTMKFIRLILLN